MSLVSDTRLLAGRLERLDTDVSSCETEYAFLLGRYVTAATLRSATATAARWGVRPHEVLIATGWVTAEEYYRALALACGAPFNALLAPDQIAVPKASLSPRQCLAHGILKDRTRDKHYVLAPERLTPNALRHIQSQLYPHGLTLASPQTVRRAICHHFARAIGHDAVQGLAARHPERSAHTPLAAWQRLCIALILLAGAGALLLSPIDTLRVVTLALAALFVPVIGLRLLALYGLFRGGGSRPPVAAAPVADSALPIYTILVPLYREAHMLPAIIQAVTHLDWPAAKLDIKLILEASDAETVASATALALPGNIEIVIVPELHPRTKPKALNYALPLARGEYLVIYDAEDRPEREQLRRAFQAFRDGPPDLAAVQARLNLYNADDGWLTRQFTIEYSALFDGLLPALDRLQLPLPLGGSSNHFRVSALTWLMAWDPFNVTEDADLGMRLARNSYRCRVIDSTTYEEAPRRFRGWLGQRTRWLKGFVQTWLVHMRAPRALWRELGGAGFVAFQVMIGGTILSALVHPWFYALAAYELTAGGMLSPPASPLGWPFWVIAWFSLSTGYLAAMALGAVATGRRGHRLKLTQIALMPAYWLLISLAAYRALWQFMTARFVWEKTAHGLARSIVLPAKAQPPLR